MSGDVTASVTNGHSEVKPASRPASSQVDVCTYDAVDAANNERICHRRVRRLITEPKWRHDVKRQVARLSLHYVILSHH